MEGGIVVLEIFERLKCHTDRDAFSRVFLASDLPSKNSNLMRLSTFASQ